MGGVPWAAVEAGGAGCLRPRARHAKQPPPSARGRTIAGDHGLLTQTVVAPGRWDGEPEPEPERHGQPLVVTLGSDEHRGRRAGEGRPSCAFPSGRSLCRVLPELCRPRNRARSGVASGPRRRRAGGARGRVHVRRASASSATNGNAPCRIRKGSLRTSRRSLAGPTGSAALARVRGSGCARTVPASSPCPAPAPTARPNPPSFRPPFLVREDVSLVFRSRWRAAWSWICASPPRCPLAMRGLSASGRGPFATAPRASAVQPLERH